MVKRKPYKVSNREFVRGPKLTKSFATLAEASAYIQARWQGGEYADGAAAFHTDYCAYELHGFVLRDIAVVRPIWDDGYYCGSEYVWLDLTQPNPTAGAVAEVATVGTDYATLTSVEVPF